MKHKANLTCDGTLVDMNGHVTVTSIFETPAVVCQDSVSTSSDTRGSDRNWTSPLTEIQHAYIKETQFYLQRYETCTYHLPI